MQKRKVIFKGFLAKEFGAEHEFRYSNLTHVYSYFDNNFPEFKHIMGDTRIYITINENEDNKINSENYSQDFGDGVESITISPNITKAVTDLELGLLVGGGLLFATGALGFAGLGFTTGALKTIGSLAFLYGATSALAPEAPTAPPERKALFDGGDNLTEQGAKIPLVYGRFQVGSTVVHSSYNPLKIRSTADRETFEQKVRNDIDKPNSIINKYINIREHHAIGIGANSLEMFESDSVKQ